MIVGKLNVHPVFPLRVLALNFDIISSIHCINLGLARHPHSYLKIPPYSTMPSVVTPLEQFPPLTPHHILAFQFSSWYPRFSSHSIKSTIIRPLSEEFREYLDSEGVFIPEGAEDLLVVSLFEFDFVGI